jgi:hypothetical protein
MLINSISGVKFHNNILTVFLFHIFRLISIKYRLNKMYHQIIDFNLQSLSTTNKKTIGLYYFSTHEL